MANPHRLGDSYGEIWPCGKTAEGKHDERKFPKARVDHYLARLHPDHRARVVARIERAGVDLKSAAPCTPSVLFAGEKARTIPAEAMKAAHWTQNGPGAFGEELEAAE